MFSIALLLAVAFIAWKIAPRERQADAHVHGAGQIGLLAAVALFGVDYFTSYYYATGEMMSALHPYGLQKYGYVAVVVIASSSRSGTPPGASLDLPRIAGAACNTAGVSDWNDLKYFIAIARSGSTLAAARALRLSQSTVHRRLEELEKQLGQQLVVRHPTGYRLTELGEELRSYAERVEQTTTDFERRASAWGKDVRGTGPSPWGKVQPNSPCVGLTPGGNTAKVVSRLTRSSPCPCMVTRAR